MYRRVDSFSCSGASFVFDSVHRNRVVPVLERSLRNRLLPFLRTTCHSKESDSQTQLRPTRERDPRHRNYLVRLLLGFIGDFWGKGGLRIDPGVYRFVISDQQCVFL